VPDSHHSVSHHQNKPDIMEKVARINTFHTKLFAHFLERMKATSEADGSLLDNSALVYGAGMADSDSHYHHDVPILLVGGGTGQLKGGRHLRFENETPLTNLHLTLLEKLGVRVDKLGDSTGRLEVLAGV
jgi:hypothetical protein